MPVHLRSSTLTAAACNSGIRVYTKTKEGDVREGCNDTTEWQLLQAHRSGDTRILDLGDGWFPGELRFHCSPDSTLCAIAWDGWSQSVFYQTEDGCIRERMHLNYWEETSFVQPDCMMGTNLAAVYSHAAEHIYLFFQDNNGYLCYRHATWFEWSPAVRLQKAAKCTGIGATSWEDCEEIRVYFQDENNVVREYCGGRDYTNWSLGGYTHQCSIPIGDIAAVSWLANGGAEIRIYFQEENCDIIEWCHSYYGRWALGDFRHAALPNSDIIAYIRNPGGNHHICVMWAGQDQTLWQKVDPEGYGWLKETPIAFLQATGRFFGSWTGTSFTDNSSNVDRKVIRQLRIQCGEYIDGLALDFTDGSSTEWHGGRGGNHYTYTLDGGEDFISIRVMADKSYVNGLQFITSKGRESMWYGSRSGVSSNWELDGRALAGFMGSTGRYINGLMPFWSERYSPATLTNLQSCITEGEHIRKEIELASTRCAQLRHQTEQLQHDIEVGLRAPADRAIQGVGVLCGTIQDLYDETQKAVVLQNLEIQRLVKVCKGQAAVVAQRFKDLHDESTKMMNASGELSLECTAKLGESETRMTRLNHLQSVADGLKKGAEVRADTMRDKQRDAQNSANNASETKREAERKRRSAETARTIRDIFTLGLGRLGDWFGLDEAVDYANKLVESCQRNLERAQQDMRDAQNTLSNISSEVNRFIQLHSNIDSYKQDIQGVMRAVIALREKNMQLQNTSLDLSLFLSGLVARSETIQTKFTAAQFAKAIISVEQLLITPTNVRGLIRDNPTKLESTMEMIAKSDAVAEAIEDMM
ncbi:hypothetical protein QCA50_001618 [Cerrena zonata]|uniref:Jacalin-type lectin domain-containing protein n=1 Tax=Cerrena zonata TaxID=2478898 RepID=A0AAW0GP44_9APHY